MPFYAVKHGRKPGIYSKWSECEENIKDFEKAIYRKFENESDAKNFMKSSRDIKIQNTIQDILNRNGLSMKNEINVETNNLLMENVHVVKKDFDFKSVTNIYLDAIYISSNGDMEALGSVSVFFGEEDTRNETRVLTNEKYPNITLELIQIKGVLIALNKVVSEVVEQKTIVIHFNSLDTIKNLTNNMMYIKNGDSIANEDLIFKGHKILKKYPNIKFFYNKGNRNSELEHEVNLMKSQRLNNCNLRKYFDPMVFTFGKYKNKSFGLIYQIDPDYFDWCLTSCKHQINEVKLFLESKND